MSDEPCPGCSGQCPSCGRDIQGETVDELRSQLTAERTRREEAERERDKYRECFEEVVSRKERDAPIWKRLEEIATGAVGLRR